MEERPETSIIIPVYNDRAKLEKCMESLYAQTYPAGKVEVVVIDDGSDDGVENWLSRRFPGVKFLRKERTGPDDSRNKGLQIASGEMVGFIDSDCIADPDWIRVGISILSENKYTIVTGRVIPGKRFIDKAMAILEFGEFLNDKSKDISNFVTCNLFARKEIFRDHPFPLSVWMGGDRLLSWKLHKLGWRIRYHAPMEVLHLPNLQYGDMVRRIKTYSLKTFQLRKVDPSLPGGKLLRLSILAPPLLGGARFLIDLKNLFKNRKSLDVRLTWIPLLIFSLFLTRTIGAVTMMRFLLKVSLKDKSNGKTSVTEIG